MTQKIAHNEFYRVVGCWFVIIAVSAAGESDPNNTTVVSEHEMSSSADLPERIDVGIGRRAVVVDAVAATVELRDRVIGVNAVLTAIGLTCGRRTKESADHGRCAGDVHARRFVVIDVEIECVKL